MISFKDQAKKINTKLADKFQLGEYQNLDLANIKTQVLAGFLVVWLAVVWWDSRLSIIALGGRSRLSTFVSGAFLLVLIFVLKDIVVKIPMAALVGVMIMVAFETFDWKSLKLFRELAPSQAVIMPITMVFALWTHDEREGGCSGFGG